MSSGRAQPARSVSIPWRMARDGSSGVAGSLVIEIAPVFSSRHTKSENVPPVSTVTRYFPKVVLRCPDCCALAWHSDCVHSLGVVADPQGVRATAGRSMGNAIGNAQAAEAGCTSVAGLRPQIAYTDLREWIEEARKLGEIRQVKGLSWQNDIGQAAEVILHDENAPCVLFTDVPGTLKGSKVLV